MEGIQITNRRGCDLRLHITPDDQRCRVRDRFLESTKLSSEASRRAKEGELPPTTSERLRPSGIEARDSWSGVLEADLNCNSAARKHPGSCNSITIHIPSMKLVLGWKI
jgi:hypothetical protein